MGKENSSKIFDYSGLPKPKEKEGFGDDFCARSEKMRAEEKSKSRVPEGCACKKIENGSKPF
jgi:hypothetical protein